MKNLFNSRFARISLGLVLLVLLVASIVPNLYHLNSVDGVVNARTVSLSSPIEGVFRFDGAVYYGRYFKQGERIGEVVNERINLSFLHELETEVKTLRRRVESLDRRIEEYSALKKSLDENLASYRKFSAQQYEYLIKQEEFRLTEEKAEYSRAKVEFEANRSLAEKGAINKRLLEQTESNYLKSSNRLMNIEARLGELRNSLEAVNAGVFLGDGHNDSPYSKQRMDQMVIEISLARSAREEAEIRIEGINAQVLIEKDRVAKAVRQEFISPFDCLVWRKTMVEGSTVVIDSELVVLLDCSSIFLDVALSESQFSNIGPGDKVKYRLIGDVDYKEGEVVSLRGSGTHDTDRNFAALLSREQRREFRIWVRASASDLDLRPENYFQVGRRVEVRLPRKWSAKRTFNRFINVF